MSVFEALVLWQAGWTRVVSAANVIHAVLRQTLRTITPDLHSFLFRSFLISLLIFHTTFLGNTARYAVVTSQEFWYFPLSPVLD